MDNEFNPENTVHSDTELAGLTPDNQAKPASTISFKMLLLAGLMHSSVVLTVPPITAFAIKQLLILMLTSMPPTFGIVLTAFLGLTHVTALLSVVFSGVVSAIILSELLKKHVHYSKKAIISYSLPITAALTFIMLKFKGSYAGSEYLLWPLLFIMLTVCAMLLLVISFSIMAVMRNRPKPQRYAMIIPLLFLTSIIGLQSVSGSTNQIMQSFADDWNTREEKTQEDIRKGFQKKEDEAVQQLSFKLFLPEYQYRNLYLSNASFEFLESGNLDVMPDGSWRIPDLSIASYLMEYREKDSVYLIWQYPARPSDSPCTDPAQTTSHANDRFWTTNEDECKEAAKSITGCNIFVRTRIETTNPTYRIYRQEAYCELEGTIIKVRPQVGFISTTLASQQIEDFFLPIYNSLKPSDHSTIQSKVISY